MQSIIDKGEIDYKNIMDNFILWVEKGYMTAADVCFGIGQRTLKALTYYKRELKQIGISNKLDMDEWVKNVGSNSESSYETKTSGNGSLMRVLPAILYLNKSQKTLSEKTTIMNDLSSITHANEECKSSCVYYTQRRYFRVFKVLFLFS
jgi:thiamine-phosphate pyrophosphorylase